MRSTRRGLTAAATTAVLSAVASTSAGAPAAAAVPSVLQAAAPASSAAGGPASTNPLPDRTRTALPTSSGTSGSRLDPRVAGTAPAGSDRGRSTRVPARGPITVMLELDVAPTSSAYVSGLARGASFASSQARIQRSRVLTGQRDVRAALRRAATRGSVLYTTSAVYSGIAVSTDAARLPALGALPGVRAVHRITTKRLANSSTVPLTGAPKVWAGGGTGAGTRIGIIDSGVDYTHADFGGPGTTAAYTDAHAAAAAAPAYPAGGNVVGGVDLAGDAYDPGATRPDGTPDAGRAQPQPDANPLDCEGHGTHVAGTAAGLGVTADGATYRGPYTAGLRPADFRIGPGVAPGSQIYAIKVFGCTGSTDLVAQGLDWAADPNRDGDVSDHLDVVNLSLGGDFASPQDPDSVASDNLARLGTVVVAAAGNAGDVQDAAGSPADSVRAIAVAASDDAAAVVDGLKVEQPADLEPADTLDGKRDNVFGALQSSGDPGTGVAPYDWAAGGLTGAPLVSIGSWAAAPSATNNPDGCATYSAADTATVAGKVVLLQWTDTGSRRCGSGARGAAAFAAGASGVVLADDVNSFSAGIAGDPRLPMMLVVKQGAEALKRAVDASKNDGSVRVTLTSALHNAVRIDLSGTPDDPTDRIASFSSRGFGTALAVKPDVTAPGVTVFSADVGSGTGGATDSGTSMASPHVAGVAALVRAAHPSWSVEQVKAAILGTAGAPVRGEAGGTAPQSPARAGVGRVQADQAVRATTLAYDSDVSGAVNLSFGDVAVTADTTVSKGLTIQNTSSSTRRYRIAYRPAVTTPGVSFTVSRSVVLVPARSAVKVLVSMRLTPAAMRRTGDPSASTEQGSASYYTDAGGAVTITPTDGAASSRGPVAVAVYAAPRPASEMTAAPMAVVGPTGNGVLPLSGSPLLQGSGSDPAKDPTLYASTVSALMLAATSPQRPDCTRTVVLACTPFAEERSGDLRYVGVASDVPYTRDAFSRQPDADSGYAYFGVTAWGPWRTPASYAEFDVYVDTDAGSPTHTPEPELVLYNSRLAADSDVMVATLADLRTGQVIDQEPLNGALGTLDTGLFHSDSMILPLWLPLLTDYLPKGADGRPSSTRVGYWVQSGTVESGLTDAIGSQQRPLSVDLRSPALRAAGDSNSPVLNSDAPRSAFALAVRRDLRTYARDAPQGLLLIHHQNLNGARAQVVAVRGFTSTAVRSSSVSYPYGGRPVLTATVRGTSGVPVTGTITFRDGSTVLGTAPVRTGVATLRPAELPWGARSVGASYSGSGLDAPSTSPALRITVAGRVTTTALRASDVSFRAGGRPTLTAVVAPSSAIGTVVFRDGDRVLGRAPLVRGRATLRSPALARGTHPVRATYEGSVSSRPSTSAALILRAR